MYRFKKLIQIHGWENGEADYADPGVKHYMQYSYVANRCDKSLSVVQLILVYTVF